ncbi:unnamed protein product [Paramecium pentaurelia]|uniref:WD40-repeat-containing domain n=1 Tax=Paramecium pentaurelia TaxID=43138 RepID=A0A8S1VLT5_9CILI|nr:unnamed protein product [Paramecium pentaurelia]
MDQITLIWNKFRNNIQNVFKSKNDDIDKRITLILNFLIKEVNLNHKRNDHKIENLVFVRAFQINIGLIQCEYCFLQNKNNLNYQYSLNLIQFLEDVFYFIDQISSLFSNDQQYQEEKNYHQLRIYNVMKETFDTKSINKDIIWKINKFIMEIESALFYPEDFIDYLGNSHYQRINRIQINQIIQNIKDTQQQIIPYRSYINLLPKVTYLKKFHSQSDYIYQQTISTQFLAILGTNSITIYDIKSGIKFSTINVGYQNNNIQLFQFTKDQNYLIFAQDKPKYYLIYNMKEKQIQQMQNSQASFIECINYNNQNYLFFYDQNFKMNKYLLIEQQSFFDCKIFKQFSYLDNSTKVVTFYNQIERKWKNLTKHFLGGRNTKNIQITKKFKLLQIRASRMNHIYYTLISNSNKLIRRISSQDYFIKDIYFISQDESYIISSKLTFYEISTGKIAFEIRLDVGEEVLDVKVDDGKIAILTWDNLYIYDEINKKQQKR